MDIDRIGRVDLQEEIIREIKKHIYENQLQPGDILPSQANIALMTGASRASIREAIKTMEAQGLLRVMNGKGIYVETIDTSFYTGEINLEYIAKITIEVLSIRKSLEGMAVELCTLRASDSQLQGLSDILSKVEAKYKKNEYQADLDLLFHQTLISYAGNSLLSHMLKNLMQQSTGLWKMEDIVAEILSESIPGHRPVVDAMIARDVKGAVEAHNRYMDRTLELLSSFVDQNRTKAVSDN